jgi:hypothetical protein
MLLDYASLRLGYGCAVALRAPFGPLLTDANSRSLDCASLRVIFNFASALRQPESASRTAAPWRCAPSSGLGLSVSTFVLVAQASACVVLPLTAQHLGQEIRTQAKACVLKDQDRGKSPCHREQAACRHRTRLAVGQTVGFLSFQHVNRSTQYSACARRTAPVGHRFAPTGRIGLGTVAPPPRDSKASSRVISASSFLISWTV